MNSKPTTAIVFLLCVFWLSADTSPAFAIQAQNDAPRELSGLSSSEAFQFKDDLPLDPSAPIIKKMLYRLRKTSPATIDRFLKYTRSKTASQAWQDAAADPIGYRFWLLRVPGRLKRTTAVPTAGPQTADSIKKFYRCDISFSDMSLTVSGQPTASPINCTVFCRRIPKKLPLDTGLDEPIRFNGLFFCRYQATAVNETSDDGKSLAFIADRLEWYPETSAHADASETDLASRLFDVAQLDEVRRQNAQSLSHADSEAFYRMLIATENKLPDAAPATEAKRVSLKQIVAKSQSNIGAPTSITAYCRSCNRVNIENPDVQKRLGIEEYYQLMLFPNLDQKIVLNEMTDQGPSKVTYDRFPVTVCCRQLPAGFAPKDFEGEKVRAEGFFFRIWKFDSEITQEAGLSGSISPLILANSATVLPSNKLLEQFLTWAVLIGLAAVMLAIGYFRFFPGRRSTTETSILESLPERIDTTGLD